MKLDEVAAFAQHHALMLWEDCAECYAGLGYRGNKQADASLFSFGPIKFSTALQGGVLCLRDASLAAKARSLHSCWPIQSRLAYFLRALRFFVLVCLQANKCSCCLY